MVLNYIKITWRTIKKHKVYSLITISGLALGLTCMFLFYLWITDELSYDNFHENGNRIFRVQGKDQHDFHTISLPGPYADYLKDTYPEIQESSIFGSTTGKLSINNIGSMGSGYYVHPSFAKIFNFTFLSGNPETPLPGRNSIIITENTAKKLYKNSDPLGKSLMYNDRFLLKITGVLKNIPQNSHLQFDYLLPYAAAPENMKSWDVFSPYIYVKLNSIINYKEFSKKISHVYLDRNPDEDWKVSFYLNPLKRIHLYDPNGGGLITYVYLFSVMAFIVLLIACVNFMNLYTARSYQRTKEIGVKMAAGSTRSHLIGQFITEAYVYTFISVLCALILVKILIPQINTILHKNFSLDLSIEMIITALFLTAVTGFIAGSYPACVMSAAKPANILKGILSSHSTRKTTFFRSICVVSQFVLSILFLTSAIFIYKQINFINSKELGFDKENVLVVECNGRIRNQIPLLKRKLLNYPNIDTISVSTSDLTSLNSSSRVDWEGNSFNKRVTPAYNWVDYDYLKTMRMELKEGRFFSKEFASDQKNAFVVNEAAVKAMGLEDPIGKRIVRSPNSPYESSGIIIGVIKDFHPWSLHQEIQPYIMLLYEYGNFLNIRIKPGSFSETIEHVSAQIMEIDPSFPFIFSFLDTRLSNLYSIEQRTGKLISYATFLAIFISCLGLIGLAAFLIENRTKEIGIRKTFGSPTPNILWLLSKDYIKWILLANLIAWPITWYAAHKWLQNFAYRITIKPYPFLISAVVVLTIALLTVSFQTFKAAGANPIDSLRCE
jgi:putative ABC transport system permease protein